MPSCGGDLGPPGILAFERNFMIQPKEQSLFTVSNHHAVGTGQPPSVNGDEANTYHGYFENRYGEQSIFIYRRATGEALLCCGDAEWKAFPVVNGKVQGL